MDRKSKTRSVAPANDLLLLSALLLSLVTACVSRPLDRSEYEGSGQYSISGFTLTPGASIVLSCATRRDESGQGTRWIRFASFKGGSTGWAWADQMWYAWSRTVTLPPKCELTESPTQSGSIALITGVEQATDGGSQNMFMFQTNPLECSVFRSGYGVDYGVITSPDERLSDLEPCYAQNSRVLHLESPDFDEGCGHRGQPCCEYASYDCAYGLSCNAFGHPAGQPECDLAYEGDWSSMSGRPESNTCIRGIRELFDGGTIALKNFKTYTWTHKPHETYPPDDLRPTGQLNDYAIRDHYQGFVYTGNSDTPYAFVHSGDEHGVVGFIDDDYHLVSLHRTQRDHPNGMFVYGHAVGIMDMVGELALYDVRSPTEGPYRRLVIDPGDYNIDMTDGRNILEGGGGVGLVRLRTGNTLLVVINPSGGGPEFPSDRTIWIGFWEIEGDPLTSEPVTFTFRGVRPLQPNPNWPWQAKKSEGLSLLTECETGDIYMVTGSEVPDFAVDENFFLLWQIEAIGGEREDQGFSRARSLSFRPFGRDRDSCYVRAAGSVGAMGNHAPIFLCHERSNHTGNEVDFRQLIAN